jgi:hypothetical protein
MTTSTSKGAFTRRTGEVGWVAITRERAIEIGEKGLCIEMGSGKLVVLCSEYKCIQSDESEWRPIPVRSAGKVVVA